MGSVVAHEVLNGIAELASPVPQLCEEVNQFSKKVLPKSFAEPLNSTPAAPTENYQHDIDRFHQKIDGLFATDFSKSYTPEAKAAQSEGVVIGIMPPPGNPTQGSGASKVQAIKAGEKTAAVAEDLAPAGRKIAQVEKGVKAVTPSPGKGAVPLKTSEIAKELETAKPALTTPNATRGWRAGEPINNLTRDSNVPSWDAVRARFWKDRALNHPEQYKPAELERMRKGLAPQRKNPATGKIESKELHHAPPQRDGGLFDVIEVWPEDHARLDPSRYAGR